MIFSETNRGQSNHSIFISIIRVYRAGICKFVVTIRLYGYNLCNVNIYFRFGRKPTLFMCLLLLLVAGCVASAAPNFYVFIPFYILQGAAQTGLFLVTFTLGKSKEAILWQLYAPVITLLFLSHKAHHLCVTIDNVYLTNETYFDNFIWNILVGNRTFYLFNLVNYMYIHFAHLFPLFTFLLHRWCNDEVAC